MGLARKTAMKWGEKDYRQGWDLSHNPYMVPEFRKMWIKGFKRAKGREWLKRNGSPDSHLGAVCA
jgi:hypothetical protein